MTVQKVSHARKTGILIGALLFTMVPTSIVMGDTNQVIAIQDFDQNNDALPGSFNPATDNRFRARTIKAKS